MLFKKIVSLLLLMAVIFSCTDHKPASWSRYLENAGTYSSVRTVDLNKDGVLDIVIGAGGKEEMHSDSAVIALDGATGRILWAIAGSNQYVGSAVFMDINDDKIEDIFIGGRWAQLPAAGSTPPPECESETDAARSPVPPKGA